MSVTFKFPSGNEVTIHQPLRGAVNQRAKRRGACKFLGGPADVKVHGCRGAELSSTWNCDHPEHKLAAPLVIIQIPGATTCATCPHWEQATEPGYARLGLNRLTAEYKWRTAGKPVRTTGEVAALLKICSVCPFFAKGKRGPYCGKCGCPVNLDTKNPLGNKLAMATEACPLDPPKWT